MYGGRDYWETGKREDTIVRNNSGCKTSMNQSLFFSSKEVPKSGPHTAKKSERTKSSIRAKAEHVSGVVQKLLFYRKTRYRRLEK